MCGCNGGAAKTRTVYRVIYPDGTRSADYTVHADAEADNARRGRTGTVVTAAAQG